MKGFDLFAVISNPQFSALLLEGFRMTLVVAVGSWLLAMALAFVLLVIRLTRQPLLEAAVRIYVSYHRNVPTLVQLILWYFGIATLLPVGLQDWMNGHNSEALFAVIGLGLCQAAYFSEDLRSGIRAVPKGQEEAARALGHGHVGTFRYVLLPQAIRNALPALINHSVSLFKNSSLALAIGVSELTHAVKEVDNLSFRTFETYVIATFAYLVCSLMIMAAGELLNGRLLRAGGR